MKYIVFPIIHAGLLLPSWFIILFLIEIFKYFQQKGA